MTSALIESSPEKGPLSGGRDGIVFASKIDVLPVRLSVQYCTNVLNSACDSLHEGRHLRDYPPSPGGDGFRTRNLRGCGYPDERPCDHSSLPRFDCLATARAASPRP